MKKETVNEKLLRLWKERQKVDVSMVKTLEEAEHFYDKVEDLVDVPANLEQEETIQEDEPIEEEIVAEPIEENNEIEITLETTQEDEPVEEIPEEEPVEEPVEEEKTADVLLDDADTEDLMNLKKDALIKIAEAAGIDPKGKTKAQLTDEIINK